MEPNKCSAWEWVSWDELRADAEKMISGAGSPEKTLFLPLVELFTQRPDFSVSKDSLV
jgi:8-oxo-dGTP diphosphatase